MGNAEMGKILEYIEKLLATNEEKCYEAEKKMYANKEMAIEDRIQYATTFCEYNAVCITLRGIISLIKGSFETEKFWEEKKQDNCLKEKDCIFGRGNLCDKCSYNKKSQKQETPKQEEKKQNATSINREEEKYKIVSIRRQELIAQLVELVNPAQAKTLKELEKAVLEPEEYNTNIPFHTWMHRTQGVIQVILNTPEYSDDTRAKIIEIMHNLLQIQCL